MKKSYSQNKNASSFIVFQGYIVRLGAWSAINSPRSGIYPVKWKDNRIPEGAKLGSYVSVMGQLVTFNLGKSFVVIKAEALKPKTIRDLKKFLDERKHAK